MSSASDRATPAGTPCSSSCASACRCGALLARPAGPRHCRDAAARRFSRRCLAPGAGRRGAHQPGPLSGRHGAARLRRLPGPVAAVARAENERLRQLLGLSHRLSSSVPAEVLHQPQATDGRTLLLSAGTRQGVAPFNPVVAPEGLIGVMLSVSPLEQHCDVVGPSRISGSARSPSAATPSASSLPRARGRQRGRARIPRRSLSGLGPAGDAGAVLRAGRRVPQGHPRRNGDRRRARGGGLGAGVPAAARREPRLRGPRAGADRDRGGDLAPAFPSDSQLEAMRLDSIARVQRADSVAQALKAARAARRDSLPRARPCWAALPPASHGEARPGSSPSPVASNRQRPSAGTPAHEFPACHPGAAGSRAAVAPGSPVLSPSPALGLRGSAPISC